MKWTLFPAADFPAHAQRWQQLNRATVNSPLLHSDFVQPLLAEFCAGSERLAVCEDGGKVQAMAILMPRRRGMWETFQPSQQPTTLWLQQPQLERPLLLAGLTRALPGLPLGLGLTQCDPDLLPRPADTALLRSIDYVQTSRITLGDSFEQYWAARGKNLRSNLKKQRSRLQKDGIAARLQISRAPEEMAQAIRDYGLLESAGWKAQQGTAIHPDNEQGRFYRAMLERHCQRGAGSVYRYWFDERLVAMNMCIEGADSMVILKTTYDEQLSSHYSPAFLMLEETCQQLFEQRRHARIEFYGKVMEWHLRWTDEVRTMYHSNSYRWPALQQLHTLMTHRARAQPAVPSPQPAPSTE